MARSKTKAKTKTAARQRARPGGKAKGTARAAAKASNKRAAKRPAAKRSTKRAVAPRPAAKRGSAKRPIKVAARNAPAQGRTKRILDLAQVIRSKNAGPFEVTFDIMFDSAKNYRMVRDSGIITRKLVSKLYGVSDNAVLVCRSYDPAQAFKITIRRPVSSGDIGDSDVYGCQQHVPLTSITVPV